MLRTYPLPEIRGLPLVADWIKATISDWPGVKEVHCSPTTGRLRVDWDERIASPKDQTEIQATMNRFSLKEAFQLRQTDKSQISRRREHEAWHSLRVDQALNKLGSDAIKGLGTDEVALRLQRYGANRVPHVNLRSQKEILLSQFNNPSTLLLGGSALASLLTGGLLEAGVILGVVALNGGIGFITEAKAEHSLRTISETGPMQAFVLRNGSPERTPVETIVPGDILLLRTGTPIAADARVISAENLFLDESILTGESQPVRKASQQTLKSITPVTDRSNMVFKGSIVVGGRGLALVVSTGRDTQEGRIQLSLGTQFARTTRLQKKLEVLNQELIQFSTAASGLLFGLGLLRGQSILQLFRTCISMAVAAVPEGLPMVSTLALTNAFSNLLNKRVLIRDLQAIETLGATEILCLDKTGTLTENKMRVVTLAIPALKDELSPHTAHGARDLRSLAACAVLCNDANIEKRKSSGSPTELALRRFAKEIGIKSKKLQRRYPRTKTQYRSETQRYMVTWHEDEKGRALKMMKGDPEEVLVQCSFARINGQVQSLNRATRTLVLHQNEDMAGRALRILGFAYQKPGSNAWIWLGLIGLEDPPRANMTETLARFHEAGVRTVMITGDQVRTAEALARQLRLPNGEPLRVVDFQTQRFTDDRLREVTQNAHVFARVAPEQKKEIISVLRASGRTVAMVGDGINDALALKAAHVGIAIGKKGAETAREVAAVVLLEDRLENLLDAMALGRATGESLRTAVHYLISTNASEMAVVIGETAVGVAEVMDPLHLLWINLISDIFPALALALDRPRIDILRSPPPPSDQLLLSKQAYTQISGEATFLSSLVLSSLLYGHLRGLSKGQNQTIALNTLALSQLLHAFTSQSERPISWSELVHQHKRLAGTVVASAFGHLALLWTPSLRRLFKIEPLGALPTAVSLILPLIGHTALEVHKNTGRNVPFGPNKPS